MDSEKYNKPLLLGTRASALASWQAEWVASRLVELGHNVELVPIVTHGDRNQQAKIGSLGSQNVFTKEIQQALLDGHIDLAVHSLKDLATEPVEGLTLAAVPPRGPIGDVLVWPDGGGIESLAEGAIIGTGSPRRRSQLLHVRADLRIHNIRGNIDTRLAKLEAGQYDAIVLAEAGLRRLGLDHWIGEIMPMEVMLPAVGQGALAIETRADDSRAQKAVSALDDAKTRMAVTAERAMLAALEGGCQAPIAAWARVENGQLVQVALPCSGRGDVFSSVKRRPSRHSDVKNALVLSGRVLSVDGSRRLDAEIAIPAEIATSTSKNADTPYKNAAELGRKVAQELLSQDADSLIQEARSVEN